MAEEYKDHYAILGVARNAALREIKQAYHKLLNIHHPDKHIRMKANYLSTCQKSGQRPDGEIVAMFDRNFKEAEAAAKDINVAYETLADARRRSAYNRLWDKRNGKVEAEIIITPSRLDFGTLTQGQRKTLQFTIDNMGGEAEDPEISWENTPHWGELTVETHPIDTFPMTVAIDITTLRLTAGEYTGRVMVKVDSMVYYVTVRFVVKVPQPVHSTTVGTTGKQERRIYTHVDEPLTSSAASPNVKVAGSKAPMRKFLGFPLMFVIGLLLLVSGFIVLSVEKQRQVDGTATRVSYAATQAPLQTATAQAQATQIEVMANYRIAFVGENDWFRRAIYVMDGNGHNLTQLTNFYSHADAAPSWSPDRRFITFAGDREVFLMEAEGTNLRPLIDGSTAKYHATWSPDGQYIAYINAGWLILMNSDGSNPQMLAPYEWDQLNSPTWLPDSRTIAFGYCNIIYTIDIFTRNIVELVNFPEGAGCGLYQHSISWSPDGQHFAFSWIYRIYVADSNGANVREVTNGIDPAWSPDGDYIAFASSQNPYYSRSQIYVMDANGTNIRQITNTTDTTNYAPAWSP